MADDQKQTAVRTLKQKTETEQQTQQENSQHWERVAERENERESETERLWERKQRQCKRGNRARAAQNAGTVALWGRWLFVKEELLNFNNLYTVFEY